MKIIRKTTLSTWIANTSTKTALHVCLFGFCDKNKVSGINLHLWHKLKFYIMRVSIIAHVKTLYKTIKTNKGRKKNNLFKENHFKEAK